MSERDDDGAAVYDGADEMDLARWHQIDLEEERELLTEKALDEAKDKGVSMESLKTLARETGAVRWALVNSIKTPEPKRAITWFSDGEL